MSENMSIKEVARRMGKNPDLIRNGIRQGKFPFGVVVKGQNKDNFHISRAAFEHYMKYGVVPIIIQREDKEES